MDIVEDYLQPSKLPIFALIALFIVQSVLVTVINVFTDLSRDPQIEFLVLGGIYFSFVICAWEIIAWAGIRTARAERAKGSELIDGAIGGALAAVIAGLVTGILKLVFDINTLPILIAGSEQLSGAAASAIVAVFGIFFGVLGIVAFLFINLVTGAFFGGMGGLIHKRRLLRDMAGR